MENIRYAKKEDAALILDFINQMAKYEKLEHEVVNTTEKIEKWIFDEKMANVFFILKDEVEVGFVLYFYNYSTFVGKPGIYVEDVYIKPECRNNGYGKKVFNYFAKKAKNEGYGRIEWVCLDWNESSINFYLKLGAKQMNEWTTYRLNENVIHEIAEK